MSFGNIFVTVFLSYYSLHILTMIFFTKKRKMIQQVNIKLDELRKVPIKTLEQQKEFINFKYPKRKGKFKWSWMLIPKILFRGACFVALIYFYRWMLVLLGWELKMWHAVLFIVIFPFFLNLVLEKFNVQKTDLSVFLR